MLLCSDIVLLYNAMLCRANHFTCGHHACIEALIAFATEEELHSHVQTHHRRDRSQHVRGAFAAAFVGASVSDGAGERQPPPAPGDFPSLAMAHAVR